jgi:hypothetical protein
MQFFFVLNKLYSLYKLLFSFDPTHTTPIKYFVRVNHRKQSIKKKDCTQHVPVSSHVPDTVTVRGMQSYITDQLGRHNRRLGVINNQERDGWRPGRAGTVTVSELSGRGPYFAVSGQALDRKPSGERDLLYVWLARSDEPDAPLACPQHAMPIQQTEMRSGNTIAFQLRCTARCFPGHRGQNLVVAVAEHCGGQYRWNCDRGHFASSSDQQHQSPERIHRDQRPADTSERIEALEQRVRELERLVDILLAQTTPPGNKHEEQLTDEQVEQIFQERYNYLDTLNHCTVNK